jgi:protein deglycase
VLAGVKPGPITASRGVKIVPDASWDDIDPMSFDLIVVPGGSRGVDALIKDKRVLAAIRQLNDAGKVVAAVCAGPLVLQEAGVLDGKRATCHPGETAKLTKAKVLDEIVVTDGNIITSQGAGTSVEFALAIVARFDGHARANEIARGMAVPGRG